MFFRQLGPAGRDSSRVTFRDTHMQADIRLLNFQDVRDIVVSNSRVGRISTMEAVHGARCWAGPGGRDRVDCTSRMFYRWVGGACCSTALRGVAVGGARGMKTTRHTTTPLTRPHCKLHNTPTQSHMLVFPG